MNLNIWEFLRLLSFLKSAFGIDYYDEMYREK